MRYGLESLALPATNKFSVLLCCSVDNFAHFSGSAPPFAGCDNSRAMRAPLDTLTPREREVLALIRRGLTPSCHSEPRLTVDRPPTNNSQRPPNTTSSERRISAARP